MSFSEYGSSDQGTYSSSYRSGGRDRSSEFGRISETISSNIQKITQNVSSIKRMVQQFGTPQDTNDLRRKLDELQHYTNQLAKDTNKSLKDLASLPAAASGSDQRQRKMQKERLTNDFTSALNRFQEIQRKAMDKEKEFVTRVRSQSEVGHVNPFDDGGDSQLISIHDSSYGGGASQTQAVMEEEGQMELLKEREAALHKLESDILDVNEIFKDLATMVHEQGDIVDSIEANVDSAEIHVEDANKQLFKAREYQKKARRKKIIIVVVVLIILAIIATIIALTVKK